MTIRGIINRGGEQGAQHSQALHAWYAHVPGLRVVMPATANDARDLLISSTLCNDPVVYIDDRWCYDYEEELRPIKEQKLNDIGPAIIKEGKDITIVSSSYLTLLSLEAAKKLSIHNIHAEVIDLRILNPLDVQLIIDSVKKTNSLLVVDGGWTYFGLSGEIIASVTEKHALSNNLPQRLTIKNAPAPTSRVLQKKYYVDVEDIIDKVTSMLG